MNRWSNPRAPQGSVALLLTAVLLSSGIASAQIRNFPAEVVRATITFTSPPQVRVNDGNEFLAPGVRVRNEHNLIALTGSLHGKTFLVNYLRDPAGLIREIWILTPDEAGLSAHGSRSNSGPAPFLGG